VSFLYPLFLIAGAALAIPVLIHLFNLRRYKTVLFPHTRFLKSIQLNSRKQSQVRYKWLLLTRLLFLISLILAFAQPFFNKNKTTATGNRLQVIYIDNSYSMSVKKGARTLLDIAKDAARRQLRQASAGTKFVVLTNDKPTSYQPQPADKVLGELNNIDVSPISRSAEQTLNAVQSLMQNESTTGADVYYYSDYQHNAFPAQPVDAQMKNITFYGLPVQAGEPQNIYIDTAFLTTPVLQSGQSNRLVVLTKAIGKLPKDMPVLQLSVNGQVKSAASLNFSDKMESVDTLSFQVNDAGWQQIELRLNDESVRFDDTFRITARSTPNLAVLVLNEGQPNPYIQAAFRAYNGFRLNQTDINNGGDWKNYNLIILNGITRIDDALAKTLSEALQQGLSVCIFPGRTTNFDAINSGLKQSGDISITGMDTAAQTATSLQEGSTLVKDLFEKIPENVQLPVADWHYIITAGLSANRQSVLSFRNGDPFLARYTPSKGQLYIAATAADLQSGNFPGSYFFAPFLYEMAIQSGSSSIYAITTGRQQAVYLPLTNAAERNTVHIYGNGIDVIPSQRPNGAGLDIFADQAVQQAGFYKLAAPGSDTVAIALNQDRSESQLNVWSISTLKDKWKGDHIKWLNVSDNDAAIGKGDDGGFPLWEVCIILAVIMLAAETYLLAANRKVATS